MKAIILFLVFTLVVYSQDNDMRGKFRSFEVDSVFEIGDTIFTSCFADDYKISVCEFQCAYLDSVLQKINSITDACLDIYSIRDFVEYHSERPVSHKEFYSGSFKWSFNRARFVKKYFQCRGVTLSIRCHVISIETMGKFRRRVKFTDDPIKNLFVFIVIRDSTVIGNANTLFESETDILPYIKYDSASYMLGFSSTEIIGEIGNYLLDNPQKKVIISLKTDVMQDDPINSKLILSFRKSFLLPMGLIGLTPENLEFNILWGTQKKTLKSKSLIISILLKSETK